MALFGKRERPPAQVLALLDRDERVLSWANTSTGSVVLATPRGLWWPSSDAQRLIGWQHVNKAIWQDNRLVVTEADLVDDLLLVDRAPVSAELTTPRDLPPTVRKRVEANVVSSEIVDVPGGQARIVTRRVPGQDGVRWWARLEAPTADTEAARAVIQNRIGALRADCEATRALR